MGNRSIGSYRYHKPLKDASTLHCTVEVFPLEVERQMRAWPEQDERRTRWFVLHEAARAVAEPSCGRSYEPWRYELTPETCDLRRWRQEAR